MLVLSSVAATAPTPGFGAEPATYKNPLELDAGDLGAAASCPDPAVYKERRAGRNSWYLYCTGDPLNAADTDGSGNLRGHLITEFKSDDLIHWDYIGDALGQMPAWIGNAASNLWAPAVKKINGRYFLYYTAPNTLQGGAAIGVATSSNPGGPWVDSGAPVVPPGNNPYNQAPGRAIIDPDVVADDDGQLYISFGSFNGGISVRKLSPDGLTSDASSQTQIAVDNRYEGGSFWKHNGHYYLFVSSTNCCDGPSTGYSVSVGRAESPLGPFLDANGVALTDTSPGGSLVVAGNGNRWLGPGGNVVIEDESGQDYMVYHAVNAISPYFDGYPGFTRRPVLIDPIDWVDGWPTVRGGRFASSGAQPVPAAQPAQRNAYRATAACTDEPGEPIANLSDEFNGSALSARWTFVHPQASNAYVLTGTAYRVDTEGPDENVDPSHVSLLVEPVPANGNWMVETQLTTSVPFDGSCCYNYAQGALFVYLDDQNSIKLDVTPIWDTRQIEFGKQTGPVPSGYPSYGNQVFGTAARTTWLRIVRRSAGDSGERYTAYSSLDGRHWDKGGTWLHQLGPSARIGLAAQNAAGFTMDFDYVHVSRLRNDCDD